MIRTDCPDPDGSGLVAAVRELDSRESDGIHVQLLWHPHDGHLSVAVTDSKTGQTFELEVRTATARATYSTTPTRTPPRPATASVSQPRPLTNSFPEERTRNVAGGSGS